MLDCTEDLFGTGIVDAVAVQSALDFVQMVAVVVDLVVAVVDELVVVVADPA